MGDDFSHIDGAVHREDPPRDPPKPPAMADLRAAEPMPVPELPRAVARVVGPFPPGPVDDKRRGTAPRLPTGSARLDVTVQACVLPYRDLDASVAFYREVLGWEVRTRAASEPARWVEVGPSAPLAASVVLVPFTETGGVGGAVHLSTEDSVDVVFAAVLAAGAEVVQEPMDQLWGVRDFVLRDPAGNTVRIQQR